MPPTSREPGRYRIAHENVPAGKAMKFELRERPAESAP